MPIRNDIGTPASGKSTDPTPKSTAKAKSLAVWWYDGSSFIGESYPLDGPGVVVDGRYLVPNRDHSEVRGKLSPSKSRIAYDGLPRGVVVFDTMLYKFIVRAPSALVSDERFRSNIRGFYRLPPTTIFEADGRFV